jgi:hypothetical protein
MFFDVWRKQAEGQFLAPLEEIIADVIRLHPEHHDLLNDPEQSLAQDYPAEAGEANPFLHMGLHIAIREQLMTDRPVGVLDVFQRLCRSFGDDHTAEHHMMECLAEVLWESQRNAAPPDESVYLERLIRTAHHD